MQIDRCPIANPMVIFREELDDWGVLFDPESNETFAVDPVSGFIWQLLDGKHNLTDILEKLKQACEDDLPADANQHLTSFIKSLEDKSLIGYAT